jgi:hypothetical protein
MTFLKTTITTALFVSFLHLNTQTQVGLTMENVSKSINASQQEYKSKLPRNPFSSTPFSCVFMTNSFRENNQISNYPDAPNNASEALYRFSKNPFQNQNFKDPLEVIFSRDASVVERVAGAILLFSNNY